MTVILSERIEQLVNEHVKAARYASPDEAVNRILEECLADNPFEDERLEALLLASLDSPRHAYVEGELLERAQRRLAEKSSA